jgi:flagellar biosynthesis protein FlhA
LKRLIVQEINGIEPELPVITLIPELEQILHQTMQASGGESTGIEPGLAERLQSSLSQATQEQELKGEPAVLLTSGVLRTTLAKFVKNTIPNLRVLSYQEIPDEKQIRIVQAVGN